MKDKTFTEFDSLLKEAIASVEDELEIEDVGWNRLGVSGGIINESARINNLTQSRLYATKDPLAKQAIRLWTDYTFGTGITQTAKDDKTQEIIDGFWKSDKNKCYLSPIGQRKMSDKLLIDGEVFIALFLDKKGTGALRCFNPLEISEIVSDPDDFDSVMYYLRSWSNAQGKPISKYYRSVNNIVDKSTENAAGTLVSATEEDDALIYHVTYNTIEQRGNPLLLPALDWIKQYRRFLASRVAIMLALARFAWKVKVKGGAGAVSSVKSTFNEQEVPAGSIQLENMGSEMQPIRTDSNATNAYQDGRMLKLQIAAAVGIPEQYFGDISIGNLATAKTVELPMMKMFQSYQAVWGCVYDDINNIVLEDADVDEDKRYVDIDFPLIAPEDVAQMAQSLVLILQAMPDLAYSRDVQQVALMTLGIDNTAEVLDALKNMEEGNPDVKLIRALEGFKESIDGKRNMSDVQRIGIH